MKVKIGKVFSPVVVTLETQDEVDALFSIFNHRILTNALESLGLDYDIWKHFDGLQSLKADRFHDAINEAMKRYR